VLARSSLLLLRFVQCYIYSLAPLFLDLPCFLLCCIFYFPDLAYLSLFSDSYFLIFLISLIFPTFLILSALISLTCPYLPLSLTLPPRRSPPPLRAARAVAASASPPAAAAAAAEAGGCGLPAAAWRRTV